MLYWILMVTIIDIPSMDWSWQGVLVKLPALFYYLVCEITMNGQSVGKMLLRIKVITEEGGQPSIGQYLIRWAFRLADLPIWILPAVLFGQFPWLAILLIFGGLFCVIFTNKSQRIGDLLAGTILIDLKNRHTWQDTVFTEVESSYTPRYPQVMQLSDRDINTLKSIIETIRRKNDYDLSLRIAERIKSKLKMNSDQDSMDFLQTLLKDYNYYSTRG
jgi:uncharacterized RDD family membrane protein YckC